MLLPTGSPRINLIASALVSALLISGCVAGKKTAAPYIPGSAKAGRIQQSNSANGNKSYNEQVITPAVTGINARIASYERRLQDWEEVKERQGYLQLTPENETAITSCQKQVVEILSGYRQIHVALLRTQIKDVTRQLLNTRLPDIQNQDIRYIEGQCSDLLLSLQSSASDTTKAQESLVGTMEAMFASGEYKKIVRTYDSLQLSPGQNPGFDITYFYGFALLKTQRQYEARRILNDLYVRTNNLNQNDQGRLLKLLADLNFGLGDYATAKKRYLELIRVYGIEDVGMQWPNRQLQALDYSYAHTEEVRSYASLFLNSLAYNSSRDGFTVAAQSRDFLQKYPQSPLTTTVRDLLQKSETAAEKWFADVLAEVDSLNSEQKSQQALELIEGISPRIIPQDKQAILKLKKGRLGYSGQAWSTEDNTITEEILEVPSQEDNNVQIVAPDIAALSTGEHVVNDSLQRTWDQAMKDMQAQNYDQSIELFSGLLNTSYGGQARKRISEASRLAAQEKRKEAAELFVRANRATDNQSRRQLLMSSRTLLEDILRKYPQSGLAGKVRRNLNRIDQELAGIEQTI